MIKLADKKKMVQHLTFVPCRYWSSFIVKSNLMILLIDSNAQVAYNPQIFFLIIIIIHAKRMMIKWKCWCFFQPLMLKNKGMLFPMRQLNANVAVLLLHAVNGALPRVWWSSKGLLHSIPEQRKFFLHGIQSLTFQKLSWEALRWPT